MNRITIGLLVAAAAGAFGWWSSQRQSGARPGHAAFAVDNEAMAQGNADIDPKMIVTPKNDIDPKMIKTMPDVDPKMIVEPPSMGQRKAMPQIKDRVVDVSLNGQTPRSEK